MAPHLQPGWNKFDPWLGHWRGPGVFGASRKAVVDLSFAPLFGGAALEVRIWAWDTTGKERLYDQLGYWCPGPDGHVQACAYAAMHGPLRMQEQPEDPKGVSIAGTAADQTRYTLTMVRQDGRLTLTCRRALGYGTTSLPVLFGDLRLFSGSDR